MTATRCRLGISTSVLRDTGPGAIGPLWADRGRPAIELSTNMFGRLDDDAAFRVLAGALAHHAVAVNSIHVPFSNDDDIFHIDPARRRETLRKALVCAGRLEKLGGGFLVIHPSAEPVTDTERNARLDRCLESLKRLATGLPAGGRVRPAVELLPRSCLLHTSTEMNAMLDRLADPRFGVCLDVNHANLREDLVTATRALGRRIITTHISDNDGIDERHWMPGLGAIPWREWRDALLGLGYAGCFMYELKPQVDAEGRPLADAAAADAITANFRRIFEEQT
ncbi:MAG: sugar phosphate isomerase/epimerase family protein [Planctomycetota bacterium]